MEVPKATFFFIFTPETKSSRQQLAPSVGIWAKSSSRCKTMVEDDNHRFHKRLNSRIGRKRKEWGETGWNWEKEMVCTRADLLLMNYGMKCKGKYQRMPVGGELQNEM